jgi:hypothetical protein
LPHYIFKINEENREKGGKKKKCQRKNKIKKIKNKEINEERRIELELLGDNKTNIK